MHGEETIIIGQGQRRREETNQAVGDRGWRLEIVEV